MQIIGADIHACQEIRMRNFPEKWSTQSTVGTLAMVGQSKGARGQSATQFTPSLRLPPITLHNGHTAAQHYIAEATPDCNSSTHAECPVTIWQTDIHPLTKPNPNLNPKKYEEAIPAFEEAIHLDPGDSTDHLNFAILILNIDYTKIASNIAMKYWELNGIQACAMSKNCEDQQPSMLVHSTWVHGLIWR
jgi:hypothetical protein